MVLIVLDDLRNFRDYIAAPLHLYPVVNLDSKSLDLIRVMQSGVANGCAPNGNWI